MTRRLRILVVSPSVPATWWGFGTRVYQLVRHLARHHDVTLLTYARPDDADDLATLREVCPDVRVVARGDRAGVLRRAGQLRSMLSRQPFGVAEHRSSQLQAAVDELLGRDRFDIVQLESSQLCSLRVRPGPTVVVDEHNVEYELLERMHEGEGSPVRRLFNRVERAKFRVFEQQAWLERDAVAVTSDRELAIVRGHAPHTPTAVVPNGVDLDYFTPSHHPPRPGTMVFTGLLSYRPNLDAAIHLVDEVLPRIRRLRPDATLTIVGQGEPAELAALRRPGVVLTGRVPDVRPHVAAAAVVVVPLRIGSGTRLKVVEALAMGKAIVSTRLGCEGIAVHGGEHLLLAEDPDEFAIAVVGLLGDDALARRLGAAGRALAEEEYSWARAGARLEDLYRGAGVGASDRGVLTGGPVGAAPLATRRTRSGGDSSGTPA